MNADFSQLDPDTQEAYARQETAPILHKDFHFVGKGHLVEYPPNERMYRHTVDFVERTYTVTSIDALPQGIIVDADPVDEHNPDCPFPDKCSKGTGAQCQWADGDSGNYGPCRCECHGEGGNITFDGKGGAFISDSITGDVYAKGVTEADQKLLAEASALDTDN